MEKTEVTESDDYELKEEIFAMFGRLFSEEIGVPCESCNYEGFDGEECRQCYIELTSDYLKNR